ncbi:heavy metal sensor histidine kinase [Pseudomonas syringae pv. syringae]|uniref:heavy metal sensor histidine kinase n=1 Tax=Pseudomonas syringae TaxID=317 RepID=UPI001F0DA421|nr:heavy metal sensor histidine kinase [Pseudomonas syringae]MCH5633797.1 heavy metal sensor histidine kinase [Pseudomonas syringae pv. syringae]MCH5663023.1 heavy metal sensor histidine kinase [Pseudomonas syringae pv. syringae]
MKRASLTLRISLMFVCAVVAVLVVAGVSVNELTQHHFKELDRQTLMEKLEATTQIMEGKSGSVDGADVELQLRALLGAHPELTAIVMAADGSVLFSAPNALMPPGIKEPDSDDTIWEWSAADRMYRGMTASIRTVHQAQAVTVWLILDVTSHMHFFQTLQWWFAVGLVVSTIVSAALGWLVARRGLRPVEQVTRVAASMSARSLKERIPLEQVPEELVQLVSSFNAMLARLDESFVRLSDFSADIAHELRTPISNLRTHTEVILSKKRSPEAYEDNLYSNLEDLNRLSNIIDGMLFLAKSDNGLLLPAQKKTDLRDVVNKLIEYYQLFADEKQIQLRVTGRGFILGDPVMLDRMVSNLLSNALRYTPAGSTISVQIRLEGEYIALDVTNPGEQIPEAHLSRIFDRFYRVDPARREGDTNNAGLGLAIVRSLVDAHGGKISCVSGLVETTFRIELPALRN